RGASGRGLKPAPTQPVPEYKENIPPTPIARLVAFLDSGRLPRLDSGVAADAPQRWLAEALAANSKALCAELLTIGDRPDVVRRLLHYLPEDDLSRLIHALAPDYAGFAFSYLLAGAGLAGDATLSPDQRSRARQVHWQTVLTLLLDAHAPSFSATRFLADVGHRVAQRLGLTFTRYAERLLRHARRKADTEHRYAALADMLEELGGVSQPAESAPESPEPPAPIEKSGPAVAAPEGMPPGSDVADDHLIQMRHFLRHGILPEEFDRDATALAFEQDIRDRPAEYRRLLLGALGRDLERLRLARWLPPAWFRRVLRLLLPDASETALTSLAGLREAAELMPGSSPALWRQWGAYELLREIHRRHGETGEDSGLLAQGEDIHATPADVGAGTTCPLIPAPNPPRHSRIGAGTGWRCCGAWPERGGPSRTCFWKPYAPPSPVAPAATTPTCCKPWTAWPRKRCWRRRGRTCPPCRHRAAQARPGTISRRRFPNGKRPPRTSRTRWPGWSASYRPDHCRRPAPAPLATRPEAGWMKPWPNTPSGSGPR
ncbi:contractile injection system tape measure protein, partial [Methylomagnum sp.]